MIPLAIGAACSVELSCGWVAARYESEGLGFGMGLTVSVVCPAMALTVATPARGQFEAGLSAARLLEKAQADRPGVRIAIVDQVVGGDVRWAGYWLRVRPRRLHTVEEIQREAMRNPNAPTLVNCLHRTEALDRVCEAAGQPNYMIVSTASLGASAPD